MATAQCLYCVEKVKDIFIHSNC